MCWRQLLALSFLLTGCQQPLPLQAAARPPALLVQQQSPTTSQSLRFPQDWQGEWLGPCRALSAGGQEKFAPFEMGLRIQPQAPDLWQWRISYRGESLNQVRDYTLQTVDAAQGHYLIDENNGILLDHFVITPDLFVEQFSIGQSTIVGRHHLQGQSLKVELSTFGRQPLRETAAGEHQVQSYPLLTHQTCTLTRQR